MAQILGFDGATLLKVDSGSGAGRITHYRSDGIESNLSMDGGYFLGFEIRQTGTGAAPLTVWAMRNGGTKVVYIRRIRGYMIFDGTAGAATKRQYQFARFSTATPTGGTSILANIVKRRSGDASTTITDVRFVDTGLTVGGVVFEAAFQQLAIPISVTSMIIPFDFQYKQANDPRGEFQLAINEGVCIRTLTDAATVGQGIYGTIEWDEKT